MFSFALDTHYRYKSQNENYVQEGKFCSNCSTIQQVKQKCTNIYQRSHYPPDYLYKIRHMDILNYVCLRLRLFRNCLRTPAFTVDICTSGPQFVKYIKTQQNEFICVNHIILQHFNYKEFLIRTIF